MRQRVRGMARRAVLGTWVTLCGAMFALWLPNTAGASDALRVGGTGSGVGGLRVCLTPRLWCGGFIFQKASLWVGCGRCTIQRSRGGFIPAGCLGIFDEVMSGPACHVDSPHLDR